MSEPRIGRVLVASLHQAIADVLPSRLEFYENWLSNAGLREGTIGLAPLSAVLSFLRTEGEAYGPITARAGEYAADWTVNSLSAIERRVIRALPPALRVRAALQNRAVADPLDLSGLESDHPAASRDGVRRSPWVAVLRGARGLGAALCAGSMPRRSRACSSCSRSEPTPASASAARRAPRLTRTSRTGVERCLLSVVVQGARADQPAAAA